MSEYPLWDTIKEVVIPCLLTSIVIIGLLLVLFSGFDDSADRDLIRDCTSRGGHAVFSDSYYGNVEFIDCEMP